MLDFITILLNAGLFTFLGILVFTICKLIVTAMICKHPELSDEKVKAITRMMSKYKA